MPKILPYPRTPGLSPMALEAIQELCLGGAGPAYQLVPPHGPIFSGLSSAFMPNTEFAPLPPIRNLRPPLVYEDICLPSTDDLVVQPRMTIILTYVEAKRKTQ
ncbi:hypothetical protein HPB49_022347 [Dermacentor silvarum]|uniref:Uncharacterized protein n=1 Tax=Dermacentor silvarum TaxID=543639 RepID=A0ACB8D8L6_DERSI|nr:hypothetical protein HPB49_022347 [Dermacentor silvarum]